MVPRRQCKTLSLNPHKIVTGLKLTIQTNRTLGGIGAIFSVLGVVSTISSVFLYGNPNSPAVVLPLALISGFVALFSFVGFILFLIAMYGFSRDYGEHRIFNYLLYGFLATIVAAIVALVVVVVIFLTNLTTLIPNTNAPNISPFQGSSFLAPFTAVFSFVGIIWVVFNVLAFRLLGTKSMVPLFKTGALVLLIGAVVNVGVGIVFAAMLYVGSIGYNTYLLAAIPGGLVQNAAWVLLAIAFFRIKVPPEPTIAPSYVPPLSVQMKYCPNCGTPNQLDAAFCTRCGQKLS